MTLKRTGFKKVTFEEIKNKAQGKSKPLLKSKIWGSSKKKTKKMSKLSSKQKIKQKTVSRLEDLVWDQVKRIVRKTQANTCYTCGAKNLSGSNWQSGHGLANGSLSRRFKNDLRNIKSQCYFCNINLGGNQEIFLRKLEKEEAGLEFLKEAGYKDENGAWRCKKLEPIVARDWLERELSILKLL